MSGSASQMGIGLFRLLIGCIVPIICLPRMATAETLTVTAIPREGVARDVFLTAGYAGRVALVAGDVKDPAGSDDLRLLQTNACYPLVDFPRSRTRRLYFAISQAAANTVYRNAFVAAQVIRFVKSPHQSSDVAVSRNNGPWIPYGRGSSARGFDSNFLGKTIEEFVDAHQLRGEQFQSASVDKFFRNTSDGNIRWHARLPRRLSNKKIDGHYSRLDPKLAPVWTGLLKEYGASAESSYRRFIRSYLISLDFGSLSGRPVVFATDPLDAEYIVVRIQSAPGSNFSANHTFAFGLTSSGCKYLSSSGGLFSWFGRN